LKDKEEKKSDIKSRALNLLSYRARSVEELRRSLREREFPETSIEETIEWLKEYGYLNDEQFAADLAAGRVRNKNWGVRKITSDLARRGIESEIITKIVTELSGESEESTAERALEKWLQKRFGSEENTPALPLDRKVYASAFRHLEARGFSSHLIYTVLAALKPTDTDDFE
jgi:regulatory protein